jgi:hypothetical protein
VPIDSSPERTDGGHSGLLAALCRNQISSGPMSSTIARIRSTAFREYLWNWLFPSRTDFEQSGSF